MAEEEKKVPLPTHLSELKGTTQEVRKQKVAIIAAHGYEAWATLVQNSAKSVVR